MSRIRTLAAAVSAFALVFGLLALAPVASADNYAPQLPSNSVKSLQRLSLAIAGAQPGCRVTYSISNAKRVLRSTKTIVGSNGVARATLRAPLQRGTFVLVTRIDAFPGKKGCTPTRSVQRIRVT